MRLDICGITKTFGRTVALDKVSFSLEGGGIYGFVGPNGAGKTTLLRILAGFDEPDSGDAAIDGVSRIEYPEKFRRRIGFMPDTLPDSRNIVQQHMAFGEQGRKKQLHRFGLSPDYPADLLLCGQCFLPQTVLPRHQRNSVTRKRKGERSASFFPPYPYISDSNRKSA